MLEDKQLLQEGLKKESPNLNSFNPPLCSRTEQLPSSAPVFPDLAPAPAEAPPRPPASPAWRRFRGPNRVSRKGKNLVEPKKGQVKI